MTTIPVSGHSWAKSKELGTQLGKTLCLRGFVLEKVIDRLFILTNCDPGRWIFDGLAIRAGQSVHEFIDNSLHGTKPWLLQRATNANNVDTFRTFVFRLEDRLTLECGGSSPKYKGEQDCEGDGSDQHDQYEVCVALIEEV